MEQSRQEILDGLVQTPEGRLELHRRCRAPLRTRRDYHGRRQGFTQEYLNQFALRPFSEWWSLIEGYVQAQGVSLSDAFDALHESEYVFSDDASLHPFLCRVATFSLPVAVPQGADI